MQHEERKHSASFLTSTIIVLKCSVLSQVCILLYLSVILTKEYQHKKMVFELNAISGSSSQACKYGVESIRLHAGPIRSLSIR